MASSTLLPISMMAELNVDRSPGSLPLDDTEMAAPEPIAGDDTAEVAHWVKLLRSNIEIAETLARAAQDPSREKMLPAVDEAILNAPRRKSAQGTLASLVAATLYPASTSSESSIMQYERGIIMLRRLVLEQRRQAIAAATDYNAKHDWTKRIRHQGPWDEVLDPLATTGSPALPMPVEVSDRESLASFFAHLREGGAAGATADTINEGKVGQEPYYDVDFIEFEKGVLYSDGRVDLCKMVTGPRNIGDLMDSLRGNTFSKHFLLGNNIIGPVGADAIASFIDDLPQRFETWYLAGNCIDTASFGRLVASMVKSPIITNIWLKRNPLGPGAAADVYRLITELPALRTLDLDQTELGDQGVAELFNSLAEYSGPSLAIRNIYLNAIGIGEKACKAISRYLRSPACTAVSLYMSNNPIGDHVRHIADGLAHNATLERLMLQSCGLKSDSTDTLIRALVAHPSLEVLDLGQGYATEDVGMRYNWLTESSELVELVKTTKMQYLNISYTPMTPAELNPLLSAVANSPLMLWFSAKPLVRGLRDPESVHAGQEHVRLLGLVRERMHANVQDLYGVSYEVFEAEHKRYLLSPRDVRFIDSVYRNRDAGMARRGLKKLDKLWEAGDETLRQVQDGSFV